MNDRVSVVESEAGGADRNAKVSETTLCYLSDLDFEVFVNEYSDRLLAVAVRFLRSPDDAADALQDAFLTAYKSKRLFQGQSTVYTWLYRIVTNACLMNLRARRARKRDCGNYSYSTAEKSSDIADTGATSPYATVERDELRTLMHAKISQLPNDYRAILLLRDIDELNTDQTARRLFISPEAVKTRLFRARQALRSLLEASPPFSL